MLNKLALRNVKRSMKDYVVYLITMSLIAALMFAFHSMLFSETVQKITSEIGIMAAMIGLATFFVILIVAWLICYMTRFMLQKRSKEFGTYLLLGMKKRQIALLYMKENVILGTISFVLGCVLGVFLQQIIMAVFYQIFDMEYQISITVSQYSFLLTVLCYYLCFFVALFRNKRRFKRMNINDLMNYEKQNEPKRQAKPWLRWLCLLAILYILGFDAYLYWGTYTISRVILGFFGFLLSIYLLYLGLSAWIVDLIQKRSSMIYKQQHLFLFRQFSAKLRTMQFTMGTLTVLFTLALLSGSLAMMLSNYQKQMSDVIFPFDVMIYSPDTTDDFREEIEETCKTDMITDTLRYVIYQDGTDWMNQYLYTHASVVGNEYKNRDGSINYEKIATEGWQYNTYDTYMRISDYNRLRGMLGYEPEELASDEYMLHCKSRIKADMNDEVTSRKIMVLEDELHLTRINTEEFGQNGQNGADYIIIVPDEVTVYMTPYYKVCVMDLIGSVSEDLADRIESIRQQKNPAWFYDEDGMITMKAGSDQIISYSSDVIVQDNAKAEMKFVLTAVVFPLVYIDVVFLCAAFTILAVQQLSDSNQYRFRYSILRKLGIHECRIRQIILKQLSMFYLCPVILAILLSGSIAIFASERFIFYTGVKAFILSYFGMALAVFIGSYLIYFIATYTGFVRNVSE